MDGDMNRYFLIAGVLSVLLISAFGITQYVLVDTEQELIGPPIETYEESIDINQAHCLSTNIYHEARGESYAGKVAVANVTMNRVKSSKFPNTICEVVYQSQMRENWKGEEVPKRNKCQFSWYCDGKSDDIVLVTAKGKVIKERMIAWEMSQMVANQSLRGNLIDITDGSTHYFNSELANPHWANAYQQVVQIDSHSFLKED
jgi:spore germination cell wall hydrolase CwlJ-like protein